MIQPILPKRRRRWPLILLASLLLFCGLWTGLWYFSASIAEGTIAGWRAREMQAGRIHSCATQTVEGFPFRFALRCVEANVELKSNAPPVTVQAKGVLVTARLWQPTILTSEFVGPLTVAVPDERPGIAANWKHAQIELHGLAISPEHVIFRIEEPLVDRALGGEHPFRAARLQLDGRLLSGTVRDHPVIEIALKLVAAAAPGWHPAAAVPVDADVNIVLRGLDNFSPQPWPDRFRQLQAAGGRIEIARARVQQGDIVAVANGALGLSPSGRLHGQLSLTVANLGGLLPALGLDRALAERSDRRIENALGALDRILPGLGDVARQNAGPAIVAGIKMMGQPTELEGRRAVIVPLRFNDGAVSLGPLPVGHVPPLF